MGWISRALGAVAVLAGVTLAAAPTNAAPAQIDRNGVLVLLRTTLPALDDADKTGNYTTFRDLAAPGFAATNTAAKLGDIFASNRRDGLDLSGVAVLDPQLTVLPEIRADGMMRMAGFFPSVPKQVNFELLYQPVNGQWRLFGISVNIGPSGPVAPMPPPPPPVAAASPKAKKPETKTTKSEIKRSQGRVNEQTTAQETAPPPAKTPPPDVPTPQ